MHERVVDILVLIPEFLSILDNLAFNDVRRLMCPTTELLARLDNLWHEYEREADVPSQEHFRPGNCQKRVYPNAFAAMTVCHFDCARVVLMSILAFIAPDHEFDYPSEITRSCESILSCVAFIGTHDVGCAYLRMMLPLVLVATNSPSASQRGFAHSTVQKWHSKSMMTGVSSIALHTIGIIRGNRGEVQTHKDSGVLVV